MKLFKLSVIVFLISFPNYAQRNFDNVTIETIKLTDNVYMLIGSGGN
ncbi:hypothetical protein Q4Q39_13080 [Flavivirga amylovorans]|uniref:MBL fold metallo-hydrolase n=1 Tax=Flavivirga amylovorans TaxID=870486 RepID=A0ABT8X351_9FLAO|nr:hypothetical protein [Flavivirga amylovorans]MDO5988340.1 hypothetical protein [Flavivirga amylovorans]